MKDMLIRKAKAEEMLKLWGYEDPDRASPTARYFYQNISSGNALFWTADNDGELIGEMYAFLNIEEDRDFADGSLTAYLCAFRIREDYRGQGYGKKLMEAVLSDLKDRGFRHATIGVNKDEGSNLAMYRHLGFHKIIKDCYCDPCARDDNMKPEIEEEAYWLLSREL